MLKGFANINITVRVTANKLHKAHQARERRSHFMRLNPGDLHQLLILDFKSASLLFLFGDIKGKTDELTSAVRVIALDQYLGKQRLDFLILVDDPVLTLLVV